jgi:hypothetical protein
MFAIGSLFKLQVVVPIEIRDKPPERRNYKISKELFQKYTEVNTNK